MDRLVNLPPEPLKPEESQCCGQGCQFCVFDTYKQELLIWQRKCKELETCQLEKNTKMNPETYVDCVIESVEPVCPSVFLFHFKLPENHCMEFSASQHLIARESTSNSTISRPYTLISSPGLVKKFTVLIKLYDNGMMSNIIKRKWLTGKVVSWRGPIGQCDYKPNSYRNVLMIAAGTGITPLYQITKLIIDNPDDETRVFLLYGCKTYSEIIFQREFHHLQDYWNFKACYFLSDDENQDAETLKRHNEEIIYHTLDEETLKEMSVIKQSDSLRVYLCGSKAFEKKIIEYLTKIGIEKSSIITF